MDEGNQGTKPADRPGPPAGMYDLKLDDRGRLKLPSDWVKFFNGLTETVLFVTSLDDRIARIYPMSVWRENERLLDSFDADPESAETVAFSANDNGNTVEMDSQGRITFPPKLRELLKMDGQELHIYGYRGHIEVLTDNVYREQKQASNAAAKREAALRMQKAGLK